MTDFDKITTDISDEIRIMSTEDTKIKLIGEVLSNDSSRNILKLLFEKPLTANQLAQKTGLLLSLVIYHLNKMQDAEIVKISKIAKNDKEHDMKYYAITKFAIIIMPSKASESAKKSKSLFNSLRRTYRFVAIGIATFMSWIISKSMLESHVSLDKSVWGTNSIPENIYLPIVVALSVTISGLIVELIIKTYRK